MFCTCFCDYIPPHGHRISSEVQVCVLSSSGMLTLHCHTYKHFQHSTPHCCCTLHHTPQQHGLHTAMPSLPVLVLLFDGSWWWWGGVTPVYPHLAFPIGWTRSRLLHTLFPTFPLVLRIVQSPPHTHPPSSFGILSISDVETVEHLLDADTFCDWHVCDTFYRTFWTTFTARLPLHTPPHGPLFNARITLPHYL